MKYTFNTYKWSIPDCPGKLVYGKWLFVYKERESTEPSLNWAMLTHQAKTKSLLDLIASHLTATWNHTKYLFEKEQKSKLLHDFSDIKLEAT